jgi:competence protein ComEA
MPTKGERKALLFLAAVVLLGAGTRACNARREVVPTVDLDRQIGAVETSTRGRKAGRGSSPRTRANASKPDSSTDTSGLHPAARSAKPHRASPASRVDLDAAPPAELERLPGVGPALAKRIVDDRNARGPFGCVAALHMVRGIGPALLARVDSLVNFSGAPRAVCQR